MELGFIWMCLCWTHSCPPDLQDAVCMHVLCSVCAEVLWSAILGWEPRDFGLDVT